MEETIEKDIRGSYRDSVATITQEGKRNFINPKQPKGRLYNLRTRFSIFYLLVFFMGRINECIKEPLVAGNPGDIFSWTSPFEAHTGTISSRTTSRFPAVAESVVRLGEWVNRRMASVSAASGPRQTAFRRLPPTPSPAILQPWTSRRRQHWH